MKLLSQFCICLTLFLVSILSVNGYFEFIPKYKMTIFPNTCVNLKTNCGFVVINRTGNEIKSYKFHNTTTHSTYSVCNNDYLFADWYEYKFTTLDHNFKINWDREHTNIYIFKFLYSNIKNVKDIWDTFYLFLNYLHLPLTQSIQNANRDFLIHYTNQKLSFRNSTIPYQFDVEIPQYELMPNGTILALLRLDGLLTMEAYGMGSGTGHIAIIIWDNNVPYVYESNDKTVYWPDKGIQRHTWKDWLNLVKNSDFLISVLPLERKYSSMVSESAHLTKWLESVIGLPYGYHNYLFGWIDTPEDNFPSTLSSNFLEIMLSQIDKKYPEIGFKMWNQALAKRLELDSNINRTTIEIYEYAQSKLINFTKLVTIPENDSWIYSDGLSMVCNVFACRVFKESGFFGNLSQSIQCSEFQNWDTYSLKYFNNTVPVFCVNMDNSPFCQITGKYKMYLPGYNTKQIYPHIAEKCPSLPPDYNRPEYC